MIVMMYLHTPQQMELVNDATEHERQPDHHDEIFILIRIIYFFEELSMSQKYNLHQ